MIHAKLRNKEFLFCIVTNIDKFFFKKAYFYKKSLIITVLTGIIRKIYPNGNDRRN